MRPEAEEALRLARDPSATGEQLAALLEAASARVAAASRSFGDGFAAASEERMTLSRVLAEHPNTPPASLALLAGFWPAEFCRNPAAPLLALEAPDFLEHMEPSGAVRLLHQPDVPGSIVAAILAQRPNSVAGEEARYHIAHAGEAGPDWRAEALAALNEEARRRTREEHIRRMLRIVLDQGSAPGWLAAGLDLSPGFAPGCEAVSYLEFAQLRDMLLPDEEDWKTTLADPLPTCVAFAAADLEAPPLRAWSLRVRRWMERFGLALNRQAVEHGGDLLERLAEDGNRFVRAAARARLRSEEP